MEFEKPFLENENEYDNFYTQLDEDLDFALALSLQSDFNAEENGDLQSNQHLPNKGDLKNKSVNKSLSIVDEQWELIDPHPDIHGLFLEFNGRFFEGALVGVEVKWSPRMTLCAGVCSYEGHGGLCSVRLSLPLLKLRPRRDLIETLLHEMIHAYLFVTHNNKDHDAHGPEFLKHMHKINQETGTRISVYHSFHDEVDLYRKHWWKCTGPCQKKSPFFGIVKRAMNRAPCPRDPWWAQHQATCNGMFLKFKEPENYNKAKSSKRKADTEPSSQPGDGIRTFFTPSSSKSNNDPTEQNHMEKKSKLSNVHTIFPPICAEKNSFEKNGKLSNVHTISSAPSSQENNRTVFGGKGLKLGSSSGSTMFPPYVQRDNFTKGINKSDSTLKRIDENPNSTKFKIPRFNTSATNSTIKGENKVGKFSNRTVGGSTRMSSSTGSKTIVINKPPRLKTPVKVQHEVPKESSIFFGEGQILGSSDGKQHSTPSKNKSDKLMQSPLEKYFQRATLNDSENERTFEKYDISKIFSDSDDDDSFIIGSPVKNRSVSEVQVIDAACGFDSSAVNSSSALNEEFHQSSNVNCPACGKLVKNSEINNHLDMCLM